MSDYECKLRRIQRRLDLQIILLGKNEKDEQRMASIVEGICIAKTIIEDEQKWYSGEL